jgi:hypothetical protein
MFRISLITILSLAITVFPVVIVAGLVEGEPIGFLIYVFILGMGGMFFPSLLAAFIFYLLVRKIDRNTATRSQKIKTALIFIGICIVSLILWGYGEWLLSNDTTWKEFLERYSQFAGANIILIPAGIIITILYFSNFLTASKTGELK